MDAIIEKIKTRQLPLSPTELQITKDFCNRQRDNGQLRVLLPSLPKVLIKDWIDETLDPERRAHEHINADPADWLASVLKMCRLGLNSHLRENGYAHNPVGLQIWRGSWPFMVPLVENELQMAHMQTKRHSDLSMTMPMPPSERSMALLRRGDHIIATDGMVATGSSLNHGVGWLVSFAGIPSNKFSVVCVAAAPEGAYFLQTQYPGLKITAVTMHDHLNENAYIVGDGLGDMGRKMLACLKVVYEQAINFFLPYMHYFSPSERKQLGWLLEPTNHVKY